MSLLAVSALLISACAGAEGESAEQGLAAGYVGGANIFSDQDFHIQAQRLQAAAEEQIEDCMRQEGFDYVPVPYSLEENDPIAFDQVDDVSEEVFAERWGFGIMFPGEAEVDGQADDPNLVTGTTVPDPTASMGDAEQRAYERALYGSSEDDPGC